MDELDLEKRSAVLDFTSMEDDGSSSTLIRGDGKIGSGAGSNAESSVNTYDHLQIDEQFQSLGIVLRDISHINLGVLKNLRTMIVKGKWLEDEARLRPALVAFLVRVKKDPNKKQLAKSSLATLEGIFFVELSRIHMDVAKKLRADKDKRNPTPASNG